MINHIANNIRIGPEIEAAVNPVAKTILMVIHLYVPPSEMTAPETISMVKHKAAAGCKYLIDEGFVSGNMEGWITNIGGVTHGPKA